MDNDLILAYLSISRLNSQKCELVGVKFIGKTINHSDDKVFKFVGIVKCPAQSNIPDVAPSQNEMTLLRKYGIKKLQDFGGSDIIKRVMWKATSKETKEEKKKHFDFTAHLDPSSIMGFEVVDGTYYIKVETYGLFY